MMLTAKAVLVIIQIIDGHAYSTHVEQKDMSVCMESANALVEWNNESHPERDIILDCVSMKGLGEGV